MATFENNSRPGGIDLASLKQNLWHAARTDLARYASEAEHWEKLMCPICGRWQRFDDFSVEHIIPKQALSQDPQPARDAITANQRSGNVLLCKTRLLIREKIFAENGCNGWKGKFFDAAIREALTGAAMGPGAEHVTNTHIIALLCAAFLALFRAYGYQVALTPTGLLIREQFFRPRSFLKEMPMTSQMVLGAPMPAYSQTTHELWADPFRISFDARGCVVGFRTFSIRLPLSRDPRMPVASRLRIVPQQYKLRPDFRTAFE